MNLTGKTVWITGASSGIGLALAKEFARKGAKLILSARNLESLEQVRLALPEPDKHLSKVLDFHSIDGIQSTVGQTLESGVLPDLLVNNAGISQRGEALNVDLAVTREVMEINFFATVALTQLLLPTLIARKGGIITIASVAGKVGGQGMSSYAASKHAIIGYMDCLRAEQQRNGLYVLNVCPGFVNTNISVNARTENGDTYGEKADSIANGITADSCAMQVLQAIERDKVEVVIGAGLSRWAPVIKRFFPLFFIKLAGKNNIR